MIQIIRRPQAEAQVDLTQLRQWFATLNNNNIYLTFNAQDVKARWRSFKPSLKIGDEDISAGANVAWEQHAGKLMVVNAKLQLVYDDAAAAANMAALWVATAVVAIVFGPEGNTAGKPCLSCNFKLNGIDGPSPEYSKSLVVFDYDLVSTGVPTKNLWAGDTF